ncbi:MAG: protein kinase [Myxococcales bacterium]
MAAAHRVGASLGNGGVTWCSPPEGAPESYVQALAKLRKELPPEDAELLELRYARELSPEDVAHVVGRMVEDVVTDLERAASRAAGVLGNAPPSRLGGLRGALQEAFALAPVREPSGPHRYERGRRALAEGTIIGERYEIQQRVGDGSFGDVYRALDTDVPGHVVALKILHKAAKSEDARKTALRELRLIASVFHPSVVDFKDHGWYQERLWFVMPWYEGETLEERIKRQPLTREEAREIFLPLAQALTTMHAAGIRHQDIKPDNIFLARIGEAQAERQRILPVLIDLGVAAKEAEMIVAGTPLYFAPEIAAQYAGKEQRPTISAKADVFSLALSLRNALEPATQEQVPGTAVEAFIAHRADFPPAGPTARELKYLEPEFKRWLAKDPSERPSAEQFAEELSALTRPERQRERRRAVMRWAAPIALGSLVGLSSITYVYLKKREEAQAAQLRAEVTQDKLGKESARRLQLEESFQLSELTRQQVEDRLLARDREVSHLGAQLGRARNENTETVGRLQAVAAELEGSRRALHNEQAKVTSLEGQLFSAEQRRAFVESELRETRSRMAAAEGELDELRTRARVLLAELDKAREEAHSHVGRVSSLERALAHARDEQERVTEDLQVERRRVRELEARANAPEPHTDTPQESGDPLPTM